MKYQTIWMLECSIDKKLWRVTGPRWFHTRQLAKNFLEEKGWGSRVNENTFYRVSKFMGPIKSGAIKEI
ncbi:MAG: hypothetical protein GWN72_09770 [Nitrospinaceae bacterium]|nr:hypothetical protein [Nitrospinaceae bacterium]NIU96644.1 hypothetical protein [Nitrospinaceae bacterium]NIW59270.1 hypothetical protein [Nitrospinaceae bacterium]